MNASHDDNGIFSSPFKALVLGASGAIGQAFVQALEANPHCLHVEAVRRGDAHGFDLLDADAIVRRAEAAKAAGPYALIIDATGALTVDGVGPEKSLGSLRPEILMRNFHINAVGPLLALRAFAPLLVAEPCIYAKLSARVGSISDNSKGGWYGYRAAKAGLNQMLQTAAIELQRKNAALQVVALQPGTVRSNLSTPFSASVPHLLEPAESVAGMMTVLKALPPKSGARFVDYLGLEIAW